MQQKPHKNYNNSEKRITTEDLVKFIKINKSTFQNIGCVDLNESIEIDTVLQQLSFQDVKKIYSLPPNISNFLKIDQENISKYLHAGTFNNNKNINLSLFSSIISCFKRTFIGQSIVSQEKFLLKFIDIFKYNISKLFDTYNYNSLYNWSKSDIINDIDHGIFTGQILKLLCDFFCVNIFVLDIYADKVYFGSGIHYIPYKRNIFLLKFKNDIFEPFFTEQTRLFTLSDTLTQNIKQNISNVSLYSVFGYGVPKVEEISEDLLSYIYTKKDIRELNKKKQKLEQEEEKQKLEEYDESINGFTEDIDDVEKSESIKNLNKKTDWHIENSEDESEESNNNSEESNNNSEESNNNSEEENINKYKGTSLSSLKKMKIAELQKIASDLNIPTKTGNKQVTKIVLIDKINNLLH